jgi:hypothetical protein
VDPPSKIFTTPIYPPHINLAKTSWTLPLDCQTLCIYGWEAPELQYYNVKQLFRLIQVHRGPSHIPNSGPVVRVPRYHHVRHRPAQSRQHLLLFTQVGRAGQNVDFLHSLQKSLHHLVRLVPSLSPPTKNVFYHV